jgi:hypothetical protein
LAELEFLENFEDENLKAKPISMIEITECTICTSYFISFIMRATGK